jgi:hypothetical protein
MSSSDFSILKEAIQEAFAWDELRSMSVYRDSEAGIVIDAEGVEVTGMAEKITVSLDPEGGQSLVQIMTNTPDSIKRSREAVELFKAMIESSCPELASDTEFNIWEEMNDLAPGSSMAAMYMDRNGAIMLVTKCYDSLKKEWIDTSVWQDPEDSEATAAARDLMNIYLDPIKNALGINRS